MNRLASAEEARKAGDRQAALDLFEQVLRDEPALMPALLGRARTLWDLGRQADAEEAFGLVLEADPRHAEAHLHLGLLARRRGDHAGAVAKLEAAVAADPRGAWARLELANTMRELGRLPEAEALYRAILADRPDHGGALLGLGQCAHHRGDWEEAARHLAAAVAARAAGPWAGVQLGDALLRLGRQSEAEAAYRQVLADHPKAGGALLGLSAIARARGDLPQARDFCAAAVEANPDAAWPRVELARLLLAMDLRAEAEAALQELLGRRPGDPQALHLLGTIARDRGDRVAARALFEAATASDGTALWPRLDLAREYLDTGLFEEARSTIAPLLRQEGGSRHAWIRSGQIERAAGDHAAALRAFETAHALDPASAQPLVEMAETCRLLADPAAADAAAREALAREPENLPALLLLAGLAGAAGQHDERLALCRRAVDAHPSDPRAHTALALALADIEDVEAGVSVLDAAEAALVSSAAMAPTRFELLKRTGQLYEMQALLARLGEDALRANNWLWGERVRLLIALGQFAEAAATLDTAQPAARRERAQLSLLRGQLAEAQWQLEAAFARYRESAQDDPDNPAVHQALSRVSLLRFDLPAARAHVRLWTKTQAAAGLRSSAGKPSQSFHGQILNEYRLDADLAARLAALAGLPPDQRIAPLCEIVRDNPGHTPSAICLVTALRQAGQLAATESDGDDPDQAPPVIPRRIMQFWAGSATPPDVIALMRTWREAHPDHEVTVFDDPSAVAFLSEFLPRPVLQAYRRAPDPRVRADLFRLAWLHVSGGIYADADDRCLRPLSGVLPPGVGFLAYQDSIGTIGNNVIAAAPGDAVIRQALAMATEAVNQGGTEIAFLSTGPGPLTRAFAWALASAPSVAAALHGRVVLDRSELSRAVAIHCRLTYKRANEPGQRPRPTRSAETPRSTPRALRPVAGD